jgi:hypothetical protein
MSCHREKRRFTGSRRGDLGLFGYREPICPILAGEQQSNMGICTWTLAYLVLHAGRRFRLGIRENKQANDFGGNYPNSPSYQLLHRIYDTSIAIWNDQLQKFQDNGTPKDKKANKRSSGIGHRKQKTDYGERANMF